MVTRIYTITSLCAACNSALDMTDDRKCRNCGHDFGPPPPPNTDFTLPDMDYHWIRPGEGAWIDGWFTSEDLRRIADAIDGNATQESPAPADCPECGGTGVVNYRAFDGTEEGHIEEAACACIAATASTTP